MIIKSIKLYRTRLDPYYNNVYDGYDTYTQYEDFLDIYGGPIEFNDINKSVNTNNRNFTIRVILYPTMSLLEVAQYNYAIVKRGNERMFYFVTNQRTINSGTGEIELNMKWDSWTNNYIDYLTKNDGEKNYNYVLRRHYESFYKTNLTEDTTIIRPNKFTSNIALRTVAHERSIGGLINNDRYKVLWAIVRYADDVRSKGLVKEYKIVNGNVDFITISYYSNILSQWNTPMYYSPIGVYDTLERKYYNYLTTTIQHYGLVGEEYYYVCDFNELYLEDPYILNVMCTYNVPFNFDIEPEFTGGFITNFKIKTNMRTDPSGYVFLTVNGTTPVEYKYNRCFVRTTAKLKSYKINAPVIAIDEPTRRLTIDIDSLDYDYNVSYEGGMFGYPYNYTEAVIGSNKIPIIFESGLDSLYLHIDTKDSTSVYWKISPYEDGNDERKFNIYSDHRYLVVSKDSLDMLLTSSASQMVTNKLIGTATAVAAISSLYTGGASLGAVGALIGGVGSVISVDAKAMDAERAVDNASIPNNIATDDKYYLDRPYLLEYTLDGFDNKRCLYNDVHNFGVVIDRFNNVLENYHNDFDYVLTQNCTLPSIRNIVDRKEIEDAFNSGITKWHLNIGNGVVEDSTSAKIAKYTMNKQIINISNELKEYAQ